MKKFLLDSTILIDHLNGVAQATEWLSKLRASGRRLRDAGFTLCYHNHQLEFQHRAGRPLLEMIYKKIEPEFLQAELDTYWIQYGGGCPVACIKKMRGRLPLLHMKDYGIDSKGNAVFAEIGSGNLDWQKIISEAEKAGCSRFIVEQDVCDKDPFKSIEMSYHYLKRHH